MLTLILGLMVAWAWGAAAMASALRARDQILLTDQITRASNSLEQGVNPDAQFSRFIFHGDFLDTRSTIVFAIYFFIGMYFLAAVRAVMPKLTLGVLFGQILLVSRALHTSFLFPHSLALYGDRLFSVHMGPYSHPRIILWPTNL